MVEAMIRSEPIRRKMRQFSSRFVEPKEIGALE